MFMKKLLTYSLILYTITVFLGKGTNIYFACGFSLSSDFPTLSMQELLAKADELMYEDKQRWYDKHTQDFL